MRHACLSDTPLASHRPDIAARADTLRDVLLEGFSTHAGAMPATVEELQAIAADIIDSALGKNPSVSIDPKARNHLEITVQVLQLISRDKDRHYRMRALCYLRLLGIEGRTFEALGEELGTTRAAVNRCYRDLQRRLGDLPARGDKKPAAREKYRQIRLGKRRIRPIWSGSRAWSATLEVQP